MMLTVGFGMPSYPQTSSGESILAKESVCTQGEDPEMYYTWPVNQANQNVWSKENREEMPHVSDANCHEGVTLSLSLPLCLSTPYSFSS